MKAKFVINPTASEQAATMVAAFNAQKAAAENGNVCHNTNQYMTIDGHVLEVTGERQALGSELLNQLVKMTKTGELTLVEMDSQSPVEHNGSLHTILQSDYQLPMNKSMVDMFDLLDSHHKRTWLARMVIHMYLDDDRVLIRPVHDWAQPSLCAGAEQWLNDPLTFDKSQLVSLLTVAEAVQYQIYWMF